MDFSPESLQDTITTSFPLALEFQAGAQGANPEARINSLARTAFTAWSVSEDTREAVRQWVKPMYDQTDGKFIPHCWNGAQLILPESHPHAYILAAIDGRDGLQILLTAFAGEKIVNGRRIADTDNLITSREDGVPLHVILSYEGEHADNLVQDENYHWPTIVDTLVERHASYEFNYVRENRQFPRILREVEKRAEQLALSAKHLRLEDGMQWTDTFDYLPVGIEITLPHKSAHELLIPATVRFQDGHEVVRHFGLG